PQRQNVSTKSSAQDISRRRLTSSSVEPMRGAFRLASHAPLTACDKNQTISVDRNGDTSTTNHCDTTTLKRTSRRIEDIQISLSEHRRSRKPTSTRMRGRNQSSLSPSSASRETRPVHRKEANRARGTRLPGCPVGIVAIPPRTECALDLRDALQTW